MSSENESYQLNFLKRIWRVSILWAKRAAFTIGGLFLAYLLMALVGLLPVNNDFEPAEDGVEIFVFSGEFHADFILPLRSGMHDWSLDFQTEDFLLEPYEATHVAIGWGERNFYLHTPTWSDLNLSTAATALLVPSDTVMHVTMTIPPRLGDNYRSVRISQEQYDTLVVFVSESFDRDPQNNVQQIEDARYGSYDAFYEARGTYHAFRTCNCWAGEAMKAGGIRVGRFTPLPKSVFLYLDSNQIEE